MWLYIDLCECSRSVVLTYYRNQPPEVRQAQLFAFCFLTFVYASVFQLLSHGAQCTRR